MSDDIEWTIDSEGWFRPPRRADAMSDDLIARLRRANDMEEGRGSGLFNEAADEIERLREENRGLIAALGVTWSIGEG